MKMNSTNINKLIQSRNNVYLGGAKLNNLHVYLAFTSKSFLQVAILSNPLYAASNGVYFRSCTNLTLLVYQLVSSRKMNFRLSSETYSTKQQPAKVMTN